MIVPPRVPGGPPHAIPIIDDDQDRICRGLDPALLPAGGPRSDRVEVVKFDRPGLYLVICGLLSRILTMECTAMSGFCLQMKARPRGSNNCF